jgi:microsomal epoxide hydrolase
LGELVAYWRDTYDWRAQEAHLNRLAHFRTVIDGQSIHFVHARSPNEDARPLLLTHGWPGSIVEFLDVIPRLTDPEAHGGRNTDAFHVIAPSLPGYGFSGPTRTPGWDTWRIARAFAELMDRLGYARYGAQGGDWGAMISAQLAALDPEHVIGLHSNMLLAFPEDASGITLTDEENADLASAGAFMQTGSAYQEIQGKNPQTLGYGLTDSPAGLAGWIVEKFRAWTDNNGSPEDAITRDQILTNITVYWVTKTINSSIRLYCESQRSARFGPVGEYIGVPTAAAVFPKEMFRIPRAYAESRFNLVRYNRFDRGGHFAALEEPDLLVDDIREFFKELRAHA